jgi:Cdc6-like AAA superfamily ATPase
MQPKYLGPLYDSWSPPTLLYRDKELRQILHLTVEAPVPNNLWIEGEKGLGKTLTCQFFAQEVEARGAGAVFYVQCGSSFIQSLRMACEREGVHVPFRNLNPLGVVSAVLKKSPNLTTYYWVIDDPERVRDPRSLNDFVRDAYNVFNQQGKRHAILIATRMSLKKAYAFLDVLKSDSRLHPQPLIFQPYGVDEMVKIFEQRLHYAFERDDVYDSDALCIIAKHLWRIGSDIREGLEILRRSVLEIAGEKLAQKDAELAVEWAKKSWWREKLLALPPHWAYLVYIAAKISGNAGEGTALVDASNVIHKYRRDLIDNFKVEPLGKTSIYHALKRMSEMHGLFTIEKVKQGGLDILKLRFDQGEAGHIIQAGEEINWEIIFPPP